MLTLTNQENDILTDNRKKMLTDFTFTVAENNNLTPEGKGYSYPHTTCTS